MIVTHKTHGWSESSAGGVEVPLQNVPGGLRDRDLLPDGRAARSQEHLGRAVAGPGRENLALVRRLLPFSQDAGPA